jgi:hypothetical protein
MIIFFAIFLILASRLMFMVEDIMSRESMYNRGVSLYDRESARAIAGALGYTFGCLGVLLVGVAIGRFM